MIKESSSVFFGGGKLVLGNEMKQSTNINQYKQEISIMYMELYFVFYFALFYV